MAGGSSQSHVQALLGGIRRLAITEGDTFDFIIVGGGTAGLVLANRLTEDANITVAVLEAGACLDTHPRVKTPALYATLLGSDADWNATTEPQEALGGRQLKIPLGRALGGSSAINSQVFAPSSKVNLDTWATLGNEGWDWESLVPYFKRSHTLVLPSDPAVLEHLGLENLDPSRGGSKGPVQVCYPNESENPLPHVWIETLEKLGYVGTGDPFHGDAKGVFTLPATIDAQNRERSYSGSAYLLPVKNKPNLTIIIGAIVQKVLLTGSDPNVIATGVQYLKDSKLITAICKREVIISAGALNSPKILELSGIGNAQLLSEHGIHPVIDNPNIGENLKDHIYTGLSFEVRDGVDTLDDLYRQDPTKIQEVMKAYATDRTGPLTATIYSFAFITLPEDVGEELIRKLDLDAQGSDVNQRCSLGKVLLKSAQPTASLYAYAAQGNFTGAPLKDADLLPNNFYSIDCGLLQPLSTGSTHIRSADPSATPLLDPRYLTHPLDKEIISQHMMLISRIANTTPLKYLLKTRGARNAEAPQDIADPIALKKYVSQTVQSSGHFMGTCAMLPREDGGVVDTRLKVWGTRNLRVVDASIFPIPTTGLPMATVYAVAEKAADIVKEDAAL
ncbi:GMC oxidoreductase [Aaosphaeria arxii CBS 175.79]|uniref:GMC oxidoreductase n=1 Tax=Aaosphaeria arxii CBS 175.79 TaxID=1450172 RepID=A0A6A5X8R8_9PLEO|nr:GMC oxidoreductase [Aaosphaeria arxii CBS 175.79]KAF2009286.1 GMC oxidoreductase [Aaosphaeria arxii CBS 175.79]